MYDWMRNHRDQQDLGAFFRAKDCHPKGSHGSEKVMGGTISDVDQAADRAQMKEGQQQLPKEQAIQVATDANERDQKNYKEQLGQQG